MKTWHFEALDSLFFREAKPFNSGESGFLDSQFPPTAQTMAGVIRSAIAEARGVDWRCFHQDAQPDIAALIGKDADDSGALSFAGPCPVKDEARLYPLPLHLLYSSKEDAWGRLAPSKTELKTDMGEQRLPEVVKSSPEGAKSLAHVWLDEVALDQVLQGKYPATFHGEATLFTAELRTGIGRDNYQRSVHESMLYFTRHLRLQEGISLAVDVDGADDVKPAEMLRLGGEGRMAKLRVSDSRPASFHHHHGETAILVLLTYGDFGGRSGPLLKGIDIVSACLGKAVREGGWDYKRKRPKLLKSLVPAGSVYFVRESEAGAIARLGTHIGNRTNFGYGEIAVGIWEDEQ